MRPYVLQRIEPKYLELFERIRHSVNALPDDLDSGRLGMADEGEPIILSCHMLARAVVQAFSGTPALQCVDGYFRFCYVVGGCVGNEMIRHSWIRTPHEHIIDVYPIATVGGPVLLDGAEPSPWLNLYRRTELVGEDFQNPVFLTAVDIVTKLLRG